MRWAAVIAIWLAVAAATIGTAALLRPDHGGSTALVAIATTIGAGICTCAIARNTPD